MKDDIRVTKGLIDTQANAYEPSYFTKSNPFNTQATRDVAGGKKGVIGNARAGDKVYNPKTKVRSKIAKKLAERRKAMEAAR
jgi:hypothetical protein